jgi:hypothetical protein
MKSKLWIQKALTMCSLMALVATYSMVALAGTGKAVGELTVTGVGSVGETSFVTVNGEPAQSGRSVFDSSTISTPDGMNATVNFGKAGRIQLGSNSNFTLNSDGALISGDLMSGTLTVLSAAKAVTVRTLKGETIQLNEGETATAGSGTVSKKSASAGGNDWLIWALILGGASVGIILAATEGNDNDIGGSATTTSPIR